MKTHCALVLLFVFCFVQNTSAVTPDWPYRLKLSHWTNIVNISDKSFITMKRLAGSNPSCVSRATLALRGVTQSAWVGIWNCIDASANEAEGHACARAEEAKASARASDIVGEATGCTK